MKRILWIGGGLVAAVILVVVAATIFLASSLDSIVKAAVETLGSEVTQAKVELDEAEISPTSGEGALRGFLIGNPKGFETPSLVELGEVSLKLDIATVTDDTVVIEEILISAPKVTYEVGPEGSNLEALQRNIEEYLGTKSGAGQSEEGKTAGGAEESGGPKVIIKTLLITGGVVNVSHTALEGETLSASLPEIRLTNLGAEQGGATAGEVAEKIIAAVSEGVGAAVVPLGLDKLSEGLDEGAKEIQKTLEDAGEAPAKALEEGAEGAGEAVKKLFGD